MQEDTTGSLKDAIRVDAGQLRSHIDEAVRSSVEETLNGLLDAEADEICGASRYERSADRVDTRAGHYERQRETRAFVSAVAVRRERIKARLAYLRQAAASVHSCYRGHAIDPPVRTPG